MCIRDSLEERELARYRLPGSLALLPQCETADDDDEEADDDEHEADEECGQDHVRSLETALGSSCSLLPAALTARFRIQEWSMWIPNSHILVFDAV